MNFTGAGEDFRSGGVEFGRAGVNFTTAGTDFTTWRIDFTGEGFDFVAARVNFDAAGIHFNPAGKNPARYRVAAEHSRSSGPTRNAGRIGSFVCDKQAPITVTTGFRQARV